VAVSHHSNPFSISARRRAGGNMTFLITEYGKPFAANGFENKFKDWCRQADLPHCLGSRWGN
jgi:hypothetical protein